jgi:hypothetical protein
VRASLVYAVYIEISTPPLQMISKIHPRTMLPSLRRFDFDRGKKEAQMGSEAATTVRHGCASARPTGSRLPGTRVLRTTAVGFRWFWPSTLRYRRPLAPVLVASLFFVATGSSKADPVTNLHYAANGNFIKGPYDPGAVGFNLADVGSVSELNGLRHGVKGLVYLGLTNGADANFRAVVSAYIGNPNLHGFYIADEPKDGFAANLKAEADWIHANVPGAKRFMVEQNLSPNIMTPLYVYTPANTHIDLFGIDGYPVRTDVPNNLDYNIIPLDVRAAEAAGIPQNDIVPVYQAFGGGAYLPPFILPTAAQELHILSTWGSVVPAPAFDYAYAWGAQDGDTAISNDPGLQAVFAAHNDPDPPMVPESSTWAMLVLGFGGLGFAAYRRGRSARMLHFSQDD